jgi:hypothetical protein
MKKLIALLTLFFAFTFAASAQEKKALTNDQAAEKDIAALVEKVSLEPSLKKDLKTLMVMKYDALATSKTAADKENVSKGIEHKILSGLNEAQRKELLKYPELLKKLSH